jgi:hypothetical protein
MHVRETPEVSSQPFDADIAAGMGKFRRRIAWIPTRDMSYGSRSRSIQSYDVLKWLTDSTHGPHTVALAVTSGHFFGSVSRLDSHRVDKYEQRK